MKLVIVGLPATYLIGMVSVTVAYLFRFSDLGFIKALLLSTRWPVLALQQLGMM